MVLLHIDSYCTITVYTGTKPHSPDGVASHWQLLYNNSVHWNQATFTWWCYFTLTVHWTKQFNSVHWMQATFTWWCYFTLTAVVQQTVHTGTKPHSPDGATSHWQLLFNKQCTLEASHIHLMVLLHIDSYCTITVYTGSKPHSPDGVTSHWQLLYNNSVHWNQATFTWWCCFTLTAIVQ